MKLLRAVGILLVATIVVGGLVVAGFLYLAHDVDRAAQAYVDRALPAIVASWNVEELVREGSREMLAHVPGHELAAMFTRLRQHLGPLRDYDGARGEVSVRVNFDEGRLARVVTGTYVARVMFARAPATIRISMIHRDDRWQIVTFHVESDALAHPPAPPPPADTPAAAAVPHPVLVADTPAPPEPADRQPPSDPRFKGTYRHVDDQGVVHYMDRSGLGRIQP